MTNFNQIVMQNATVNKYYVSLDLPVYQLACEAQPLVSNSLVVRHSRIQTLVNLPRSEEETKNSKNDIEMAKKIQKVKQFVMEKEEPE